MKNVRNNFGIRARAENLEAIVEREKGYGPPGRGSQAAKGLARIALGTLAFAMPAKAADLPVKAAALKTAYDWTGFYIGGHVGYARGLADPGLPDLAVQPSQSTFGALYGGAQIGYNVMLPSRLVLGVEADLSFPNYLEPNSLVWWGPGARGTILDQIDYLGTVRGRIGYAFDRWLVYGTGGFAWSGGRFLQTDPLSGMDDKQLAMRTGWSVGGGLEYAFDRNWSARLEYLYSHLGPTHVTLGSGERYVSQFDMSMLRLGLNYRLANPRADAGEGGEQLSNSKFWEIHGQMTYVQQGYPNFPALYSGPQSLPPAAQTKNTWTASAFITARPWEGGEIYFNPELVQGFGLSDTTGAAGFPNGEAQKSNFPYPHYNVSRLFLRQTFGLGGEQETVESSYGQMSGKRDISRLTLQVGKFAVHDVFDNNQYAQDPRLDFLNWSIWAAGAFDYPADKVGLTYGAVAELNQQSWAVRGGYFLIGNQSNSNNFDMAVFRRGGYVAELEERYSLFSLPGKLRVTGWINESFSGSFREAVGLVSLNPGLDPNDAIVAVRRGRPMYGYIVNLEQSLTDDIGAFARWSWNSGKNEISAFTDINASLAFGTSIKGTAWGRSDDRIGLAAAFNSISTEYRDFLAVGGTGVLVGDGMLNYRAERVLEAFYAWRLARNTTLTFDYQFLKNPAYNADRGPISVFSGRLHSEF
ncbi:MAG: outer membrane beta-barrel protein [Bradyrhizobium sp.]|nr:outer membrane beta-barrel protein [Bradyrhizobium sp.]